MQIVDPSAALAAKPKPKKRSKKEPIPTPEPWCNSYSHYVSWWNNGYSHFARSKDPGATFAKRMKEAINVNLKNREDESDKRRGIIFTLAEGPYSRPTIGTRFDKEDASWCEGANGKPLPITNNENDLFGLKRLSDLEKAENTKNNFQKRLVMLLGTMFDVQVVENEWPYKNLDNSITFMCNGKHKLVFTPGGPE